MPPCAYAYHTCKQPCAYACAYAYAYGGPQLSHQIQILTSKTNSPHQNQIYHIKHKFATAKAKSSQQKQYSPHQKRNCHSKNKFLTSKANLLHQNPKHRLNGQRSMNESYLQFSLGLHPTAILFLHMQAPNSAQSKIIASPHLYF